jgi:hypothetical protein
MQSRLSPSFLGEGTTSPDIPTLIQEVPGNATASNPFERFNFWGPERSGNKANDYATGQRHFQTALAFARANQSNNFLANIVGAMCNVGAGPMELGFLDLLSCKATYARLPDPISRAMADNVIGLCGISEEEIRAGESEACECLQFARECRCPEFIQNLMVEVINREMPYGSLTFMWTVCGAAYTGALH